jgi:hypothetical protein
LSRRSSVRTGTRTKRTRCVYAWAPFAVPSPRAQRLVHCQYSSTASICCATPFVSIAVPHPRAGATVLVLSSSCAPYGEGAGALDVPSEQGRCQVSYIILLNQPLSGNTLRSFGHYICRRTLRVLSYALIAVAPSGQRSLVGRHQFGVRVPRIAQAKLVVVHGARNPKEGRTIPTPRHQPPGGT